MASNNGRRLNGEIGTGLKCSKNSSSLMDLAASKASSSGAGSNHGSTTSSSSPAIGCIYVGEFFASLFNLYRSGHMCDVTVVVDGVHRFEAHRIVLSASSPFFRAMFTNSGVVEATADAVNLNGHVVDPHSFRVILDYMYSRKLALTDDTVCQVLQGACYLLMRDVEAKCCAFLSKTLASRNIFELLHIASILSSTCLSQLLLKYVCRQGIAIFAKQPDFEHLDHSVFRQILQSGMLGSVTEDDLLDLIFKWVNVDPPNRASHLEDLISYIRLPLVQPAHLTAKLKNESLIESNETIRKNFETHIENAVDAAWPVEPRSGKIYCNTAVNFLSSYQPCSNNWSSTLWAPYNINLAAVTVFQIGQRTLGIVGSDAKEGVSEADDGLALGSTVAAYNVVSNKWRTLPSLTTVRCRPAATAVQYADLVLVAGGVSEWDDPVLCKPISTCEVLHLSKKRWRPFAPLPLNGGDGVRLVSVQDRIFAIGGHGAELSRRCLSNNVSYVTVSKLLNDDFDVLPEAAWVDSTPLLEKRSHCGATVLNDYIYAVGGSGERGPLLSIERFCPERLAWLAGPQLPSAAPVVTCVAYGGLLCCLLCFQSDEQPGLGAYEAVTFDPRDNLWHYGTYFNAPCRIGISYPSMTIVSD